MTLAIMQPYLFPYLGYFQLIHAVDKFVFYDDVNFIKQGWINRNRILLNGAPHLFTVPVKQGSSFRNICDTEVDDRRFLLWKRKFLATIDQAYKKAPHFSPVRALVESVLAVDINSIGELSKVSVLAVCEYLALQRDWVLGSAVFDNESLRGEHRVLDICLKVGANTYVNLPGGRHLYTDEHFEGWGISLKFLKSNIRSYHQFDHSFVENLSIIDVLMFNDPGVISEKLIPHYTLLSVLTSDYE